MTNKSIEKIKRIIYPIYTSSITSFAPNFSLSSICSQKGYGVVTKIDDSYRPITITWDNDPEPFAYTEDEIRVLKITAISSYRSNQTIVRFPETTIVETQNGETLEFKPDQLFTVSSIDGDAISIENENGIYQFDGNQFPCVPFANIVQIERKNIDRTKLDWIELRVKANSWLYNNSCNLILETVDRAWKNRKQLEWHDKIIKDFPNCSDRDLEKAWDLAVTNFIIDKTQESGLYGFNLI
jgi:hypothetical protein